MFEPFPRESEPVDEFPNAFLDSRAANSWLVLIFVSLVDLWKSYDVFAAVFRQGFLKINSSICTTFVISN